jgi:hypothetical protein
MNDVQKNKATVTAFHDLMFNQYQPAEAVDKYVGDVNIQHNPAVGGGKEAFIEYFTRMAKEYPESVVTSNGSLFPAVAGQSRLGRDRHLPPRLEWQNCRTLGRAADRTPERRPIATPIIAIQPIAGTSRKRTCNFGYW